MATKSNTKSTLINKLSIKKRLFIIMLVLGIPIWVLFHFYLDNLKTQMEFTNKEIIGTEYSKASIGAMHNILELKSALIKNQIDGKSDNDVSVAVNNLSSSLVMIDSVNEKLGEAVKTTDTALTEAKKENLKYASINEKWSKVKSAIEKNDKNEFEETLTKINELSDDLKSLTAYITDSSNLILDPDLDSYYLMDATSLAIPDATNRLNTLSKSISLAFTKETLSNEDILSIEIIANSIENSDISRIKTSIQTAIGYDKDFYGTSPTLEKALTPKLADYEQATTNLVMALNLIAKNKKAMTNSEYFEIHKKAIDALDNLSKPAIDELASLLQNRFNILEQTKKDSIVYISISIILSLLVFRWIANSITRPLNNLENSMISISEGKLDTEVPHQTFSDETGQMAKIVEIFRKNLMQIAELKNKEEENRLKSDREKAAALENLANDFERRVAQIVETVASASVELEANSSAQAASASELKSFVEQVSQQVIRSFNITEQAVNDAKSTEGMVKNLDAAAHKIGDIIGLINSIAGQINLLSLNATIEAARAGDAGKGFAVVASEVKALADQTTKATEEIVSYVSHLQECSSQSSGAIGKIINTIDEVAEISLLIKDSVASDHNHNYSLRKHGSSGSMAEVTNISAAIQQTNSSAEQVLSAASELSRYSESLRDEINNFILSIKMPK